MTKEASEKIREHIAAYPVGHKFTVDQVRRELRLPTMQSKHYILAAMVDKGLIRKITKADKGRVKQGLYEKICEFEAHETFKQANKVTDDSICPKEKNAFIFGGCAERIVANLHVTRCFV